MSATIGKKRKRCTSETEEDDDSKLDCEILFGKFFQYYENGDFCDLELQASNGRIFVHKVILCAASPVFEAMFQNKMKESKDNVLLLKHIDIDTLKQMVIFFYSREVKNLDAESAIELYSVSNTYQVDLLKENCSNFLISNMAVNTICEVLCLSCLHSDEDLKEAALQFFYMNEEEIRETDKYADFVKNNPDLSTECNEYATFVKNYTAESVSEINVFRAAAETNFSLKNVCKILFAADLQQDEDLKQSAFYFFHDHYNKLRDSTPFKDLQKINQRLALEVVKFVSEARLYAGGSLLKFRDVKNKELDISTKNVCEILYAADMLKDKVLEDEAIYYFYNHYNDASTSSDAFKYLKKNNPTLAVNLMRNVAELTLFSTASFLVSRDYKASRIPVSTENVCNILFASYTDKDDALKQIALNFLKNHYQEVRFSDGFCAMSRDKHLALEVFKYLADATLSQNDPSH